jgi:hypothetical protein
MISILGRVLSRIRAWFGLNDPSENRLYQAHGWLLPAPARSPQPTTTRGRSAVIGAGGRD